MKPTVIISKLHVEELTDTTCLQNNASLADKLFSMSTQFLASCLLGFVIISTAYSSEDCTYSRMVQRSSNHCSGLYC